MPQENIESDETFGWEISLGHRDRIAGVTYWVNGQISATKNRWDYHLDSQASNSMSSSKRGTEALLTDAQNIMDKYQLKDRTKQKYYLYQNEKPLIVLWGVGFNDNRPYSLTDVESLMNGLKEKGFSIMLGVPTYWRERRNDALPDAKLHDLIKAADVIMPWFVGRYDNNSYSNFYSLIQNDIAWCKTNKVEYAPLCFPGSSDRNM